MRSAKILLILLLAIPTIVVGQDDSTSNEAKKQANKPLGILPQLAFSTLGFLIGYIPDGYSSISQTFGPVEEIDQQSGWISPLITPFLTSAGTDLAKTNFWRNTNVAGSYWSGVAGGFLGEVTGALIAVGFLKGSKYKNNPFLLFLAYLIPTNVMTVAFYNLFGQAVYDPYPNHISIIPSVHVNGVSLELRGYY